MSQILANDRVIVTGGGGFLGRHLVRVLRSEFTVLAFDIQNPGGEEGFITGSVTDGAIIDAALAGAAGLVIAHMAARDLKTYDSPEVPFDINVKGTAMLLDAAVRHEIRRVILISSTTVVEKHLAGGGRLDHLTQRHPRCLYSLTKSLQEEIAAYYHEQSGMEVAIFRPAYIAMKNEFIDKYGKSPAHVDWKLIDPRDIGSAAIAALRSPSLQRC